MSLLSAWSISLDSTFKWNKGANHEGNFEEKNRGYIVLIEISSDPLARVHAG